MKPPIAVILRLVVACGGALTVGPTGGAAQVAYDSPRGRVEVLGLRHWTLTMLQDSIRHYVPGQELHDAACMVTLRDSLHFVEASVERFDMAPPGQPARSFLTVKVVEPDQAARVQWDARPRDEFSSLLPDYSQVILPVTDSTGAVWRGRILYWLQFTDSSRRQQALAHAPASASADADRLFAFLGSRHAEGDRGRAMRALAVDGLWVNRMTAVMVLSSFVARDSTWWVLVRALRDPHEAVREAAATVLGAAPSRSIDWQSSTNDLRLLLTEPIFPRYRLSSTFWRVRTSPRSLRRNSCVTTRTGCWITLVPKLRWRARPRIGFLCI